MYQVYANYVESVGASHRVISQKVTPYFAVNNGASMTDISIKEDNGSHICQIDGKTWNGTKLSIVQSNRYFSLTGRDSIIPLVELTSELFLNQAVNFVPIHKEEERILKAFKAEEAEVVETRPDYPRFLHEYLRIHQENNKIMFRGFNALAIEEGIDIELYSDFQAYDDQGWVFTKFTNTDGNSLFGVCHLTAPSQPSKGNEATNYGVPQQIADPTPGVITESELPINVFRGVENMFTPESIINYMNKLRHETIA